MCCALLPTCLGTIADLQVLPGAVRSGVSDMTQTTWIELTHSVALIVLFGDTLEVIFPDTSSNTWKLLGLAMYVPLYHYGVPLTPVFYQPPFYRSTCSRCRRSCPPCPPFSSSSLSSLTGSSKPPRLDQSSIRRRLVSVPS